MGDRPIVKCLLARVSKGEVVAEYRFQFNPPEVRRSRGSSYDLSSPSGSVVPTATFMYGGGDSFSISILLDATDRYSHAKQGTRADKAALELFTWPDVDDYLSGFGVFNDPPKAWFEAGGVAWPVRINRIDFKDVRMNEQFIETRTFVDIEMQSVYENEAAQKAAILRLSTLRDMVETKVMRF